MKMLRLLVLLLATPMFAATHAEKIDKLIGDYNKQRYFNGYLTVVPARITFAEDGSSLTLHQGGRDMPAKRTLGSDPKLR